MLFDTCTRHDLSWFFNDEWTWIECIKVFMAGTSSILGTNYVFGDCDGQGPILALIGVPG